MIHCLKWYEKDEHSSVDWKMLNQGSLIEVTKKGGLNRQKRQVWFEWIIKIKQYGNESSLRLNVGKNSKRIISIVISRVE